MMRKRLCLMASAALVATLCIGNSANASPAYSFETCAGWLLRVGSRSKCRNKLLASPMDRPR